MRRTTLGIVLVVAFLAATPTTVVAQDNWAPRAQIERTVNCLNQLGPCDRAVIDFLAMFAGKQGPRGRDGNTPTAAELVDRGELRRQPQTPATQSTPTATPTPGAQDVVPPAAPSREVSLPDWAWWLILAALLLALLWRLTRRRIRNDGRFFIGRHRFARQRAEAVLSRGPALAGDKRVVNLTRTAPAERRWAPRVAAGFGDLLQFRLEWRNEGWTLVSAALVRLQDTLEGPGVREGAVLLTIGDDQNIPDIALNNAEVAALFGAGLALADVLGPAAVLPPRTSVYVRYVVRVLPDDGEDAQGNGPAPAQN